MSSIRSSFKLGVVTLCKLGRLSEALLISIQCRHPPPPAHLSVSTYSSLLKFCIDSDAINEGKSLHNHLSSTGFTMDLHLSTKFIIFYSKVGDVSSARKVFDEMPQRNVVSWTAMISGYTRNGYLEEALETFHNMHRAGCTANQFTYGSLLRACAGLQSIKSAEQIHGRLVKGKFQADLFVQSALMDVHLKCGSVADAWHLFQGMKMKDVVAWNAIIGGCAVQGFGDDAFSLFCSMTRDGTHPDQFTFGNVLRACAAAKALEKAEQIHAFICKLGYETHEVVSGSLISAYAKCKSLGKARLVYDVIADRDLISCTALITGYSLEKCSAAKAFDLFIESYQTGMRIDDVILSSMLNICANASSLSCGRQIHAHVLKNRPNHDTALGNALINMYSKSGELQDAHHVFDELRHRNVVSWTSLISGYGQNGHGEVALNLFEKMEDEGVEPNDVTFLSILSACGHSGLIAEGLDYLNFMVTKYGIGPRVEHYSCVIDLLARGGQLEEAYDLVCNMNVKPSASTWAAMLGACRVYGNALLGEVAAENLAHFHPERSASYVILANIYNAAGLWEAAKKMRKKMEQLSVKKDAGLSYI